MDPDACPYVVCDAAAYRPEMKTLEALLAAGVLRAATPEEQVMIARDEPPQSLKDELDKLVALRRAEEKSHPLYVLAPPQTQTRDRSDDRPAWAGKRPWWQR